MPDSALCLCATRLYYFYDATKPWLQNVCDEIVMVYLSIRYCLSKIVMLSKSTNKDTGPKQGHFLEIRTVMFFKT